MREILFRGKHKGSKQWVVGNYEWYHKPEKHLISNPYTSATFGIVPETLGQYTGLTDKNGTKIFEGDIVEWADYRMEIYWGEDVGIGYGFKWRSVDGTDYSESITGFIDEYEVIGNIYDNPELLQQ